MGKIKDIYKELQGIVMDLERKFIQVHIPTKPTATPEDYSLDVKAYCVLSHAALEDFFEKISLSLMEHLIQALYNKRRKIDRGLLIFLKIYGSEIKIEDEKEPTFEYLRESLDKAKKTFSEYVYNNHGISPKKYLAQLMLPVGIDVPQDPNWLNSLEQLAQERGKYAHKGMVNKILSPEDARAYVSDCLLLAKSIKKQAEKKMPN